MAFDIVDRAAAGRIGRFKTPHGVVDTPTLMPVLNPNIDLISAREMRDAFGCQMVITNSYVLKKHEDLQNRALEEGVHGVLDWDGVVMTDSGTFQSWVYGDVELDPQEIVAFQRDIGVDVATCLDRFVTPEHTREEAEAMVKETLDRTRAAVDVAHAEGRRGKTMLNATVQGGIFPDLRQACAAAYRDIDVDYHTIGGVVPLMQDQMYPELVDAILNAQAYLRKDRPVHLFGAGHPLVFPLATALGCDLFDSSSYAKYAKDGRIMVPEGTLHLADLEEFPFQGKLADDWTPKELRKASHKERLKALAMHNLDVCFTDLRRVRQAIREGTLWEMVEQRAACHPLLAAATRKLGTPEIQAWLEEREPTSHPKALRYTGSLTHQRPIFRRIRERMIHRFTPDGTPVEVEDSDWAKAGEQRIEVGMHKEPKSKPFGDHVGRLDPEQDHVVISSLGPVPLGLDEAYPFAQSVLPRLDGLDREHMGWVGQTKDAFLEQHQLVPAIPGPPADEGLDRDRLQVLRTADWQFGAGAGKALTDGELVCERSRKTRKMRTVHLNGQHVLSLRATDALFTLKADGAQVLHAALPAPAMRVVVHDDSVPFNKEGKSVFCQFVQAVDPALRPGDECLVVDQHDNLVALGRMHLAPTEMPDFSNGVAVKVREGIA